MFVYLEYFRKTKIILQIESCWWKILFFVFFAINLLHARDSNSCYQIDSIILAKDLDLVVFFSEKNYHTYCSYKIGEDDIVLDLGRYTGTFSSPPDVKIIKLDSSNLGILLICNNTEVGVLTSSLALFSLNKKLQVLKEHCNIRNIGKVDSQNYASYPKYIKLYDYVIDLDNMALIVNEYLPYKPLKEDIHNEYTTKVTKCTFNLDIRP